jgi:hypothetical protein
VSARRARDSGSSRAAPDALTRIPIGRLGQPFDLPRVVELLVRLESDFVNGRSLT